MAKPNILLIPDLPNTHVPGGGVTEIVPGQPATLDVLQEQAAAQSLEALGRLAAIADQTLLPGLEGRGDTEDNPPANPPLPKRVPQEDGGGVQEKIDRFRQIGSDTDGDKE